MAQDRPVALVTGASDPEGTGNIGYSVAEAFAGDHSVLLADLRDPSASAARLGASAFAIAGDVTRLDDCEKMVAAAEAQGPFKVLVHAAGITRPATRIENLDPAEWDHVLRTNLTSAFLIARAAIPALKRAGGGHIVLVSSRAGRTPFAIRGVSPVATKAHYAASKAGIISLTRALALELAADGIKVNCVAPGPVKTRIMPKESYEAAAASVPLGRMAEASEVASVVRFLCSDAASYMTGAILDVNGAQVLS